MAKSLASVAPSASFDSVVKFSVAGRSDQSIKFRFKYFSGKKLRELIDSFQTISEEIRKQSGIISEDSDLSATNEAQAEMIQRFSDGWELSDEFNTDNLTVLLDTHRGVFFLIFNQFLEAHSAAKAKN